MKWFKRILTISLVIILTVVCSACSSNKDKTHTKANKAKTYVCDICSKSESLVDGVIFTLEDDGVKYKLCGSCYDKLNFDLNAICNNCYTKHKDIFTLKEGDVVYSFCAKCMKAYYAGDEMQIFGATPNTEPEYLKKSGNNKQSTDSNYTIPWATQDNDSTWTIHKDGKTVRYAVVLHYTYIPPADGVGINKELYFVGCNGRKVDGGTVYFTDNKYTDGSFTINADYISYYTGSLSEYKVGLSRADAFKGVVKVTSVEIQPV